MAAVRLIGLSLIATTGIAGLLADTWPTYLPLSPLSLHRVFGALLLSMVVLSFRRGVSRGALNQAAALVLCRRLSRSIYLVLYLVFGADQLVRASLSGAAFLPPENLRDYFAYGLLALVTIRVLAAISVRPPPAPQMNPRLVRAEGVVAPP
jgi:hypothetical protein